jgi:hypothetical protein
MVEPSGAESWREWTSSHVGPEEHIQGLVILERTRDTPATKHALKRSVWAQVGVHVKSSELLELVRGVEACSLHKKLVKVNELPYLTTHVGLNEYIARSLLTAGKASGRGLVIRTSPTHIVVALYSSGEDSRTAHLVNQFVVEHLSQQGAVQVESPTAMIF